MNTTTATVIEHCCGLVMETPDKPLFRWAGWWKRMSKYQSMLVTYLDMETSRHLCRSALTKMEDCYLDRDNENAGREEQSSPLASSDVYP